MTKRMTIQQAETARDRAVTMLSNFGNSESADDFAAMSPKQYAEFKGIELVASNPLTSKKRKKVAIMATKSQVTIELEDTVRDVYDLVQESGSTRADMEEALDKIAELCVDAVPDLDESADADEDGDQDTADDQDE